MVASILSTKQSRFLDEYMVDLNGAAAAVRAGYSRKCAREIAYELLTKPHIRAALQARQATEAERLGISRERVVAGLLEAAEQAKLMSNPMAMVRAWAELARLFNFYAPQHHRVEVTAGICPEQARLEAMSDAQLLALINA